MSRWKTTFDNQNIVPQVQVCSTLLESISIADLSGDILNEYSRLLKILKILSVRLSKLDPDLFGLNSWGNFTSWLNECKSEITNFNNTRNIGYLQNANANIDQIIAVLRPLDAGLTVEEFKSIADANAIFQNKIVGELHRVQLRGKEVEAQFDSLSKAIAERNVRLDENNQIIQSQKNRLDQAIADFQKQFSDAQEKRTNDFADSLKDIHLSNSSKEREFETKFEETSAMRKKEYEAFFKYAKDQSDKHLTFLQKREEEVDKIFGAIGTTAFAGEFRNTADYEAQQANLWRWIALGLMGAMICVGAFAFVYSIGHETDWRVFGFRLGTVLILAFPAGYAANESTKHRDRERQNRKIHLELASLDAYLVLLPEADKVKIKGNLTERFFGVPVVADSNEKVTQKDMFGVLTSVLNNLTKGR